MKAYKGFFKTQDGKLKCHDFIYEEGKTYEFDESEQPIKLCGRGFHACKELHQVWSHYPNNGEVEYHEVECEGHIIDVEGEDKICCSKITIGSKIDTSHLPLFEDTNGVVQNNYILVTRRDGKKTFIDTNGKLIGDGNQWYEGVLRFYKGYSAVQRSDRKWSFIDTNGKLIGDGNVWYDCVGSFSEGFALVQSGGKCSFIDTNGKLIGDGNCWYDNTWGFSEGFARVRRSNWMWSFIDSKGKLIGDGNCWYMDAWPFRNGVASVKRSDGKWININTNGKMIDIVK